MSLFGIIGEVIKAPSSIVKDVVGIKSSDYEATNTEVSASKIWDEIGDVFR